MNQPEAPVMSSFATPLPHRIGVLSALDPAAWQSDVIARVLRAHIDLYGNNASLDLRSVHERLALSRASWQPAPTANWPTTVHAVIIDRAIDTSNRVRAGASALASIETDIFANPIVWCTLFEQTLDPAAVDTRTRMLEHLGVDQDPTDGFAAATDALGGLLTLTDRYCLAKAAARDALDDAHAALAGGRTASSAAVIGEMERIAATTEMAGPHTAANHSAALQQRALELAAELADERDRHALAERRAAEALDAAAQRERSLTKRLETAFLRNTLQER
jgi:hypothetical protein